MAITVFTSKPNTLLSKIKKAIDDGAIVTWEYDNDGDFTHTPNQWNRKAWLKPGVQQGSLYFGLIGQQDIQMTKEIYGVYHGRFIETLLAHFDTDFTNVNTTAQADTVDLFK